MTDSDNPRRNPLFGLARIGAGLLAAAVVAAAASERRRPGPRADRRPGSRPLDERLLKRRPPRRRRPPEAGIPAPATPPRGPRPLQGGAAARLDFEA